MKIRSLKLKGSQAGFSLVELMIVVAIIGILSSIAVPQFQKFIFKARQTEAKTGLSSLYTAEKAFYGEWSEYDTRFDAIGYMPEGKYFYNIGFSAVVQSANYDNSGGVSATADTNTITRCPTAAGGNCVSMSNAKTFTGTYDVSNSPVTIFTGGAETQNLNPDGNGEDTWSINQSKVLTNGAGST
jgi:type IV pilus assembly protein PilA